MGKPGAYLEVARLEHAVRDAMDRVDDYDEIVLPLGRDAQRKQASRFRQVRLQCTAVSPFARWA